MKIDDLPDSVSDMTTFDEDSFNKAYPDGIQRNYWHRARNKILLAVIKREKLFKDHFLEIGCGRGFVTEALRQAGVDCYGVELANSFPPPRIAPFIQVNTAFQNLTEGDRHLVKGALLLDVLEHVEAPIEFLKDIASSLPHLKRLIITVPARAELWSKWDEFYGHRCRYDRSTLKKELEASGYEVISCRYFFHGLYLAALIINLLGITRKTEILAPKESLFHRIIGRCFAFEAAILPGAIFGMSLLAVVQIKKD